MKSPAFQDIQNQLKQLGSHVKNMDSSIMFRNEVSALAWEVLLEIRRTMDMKEICERHTTRDFASLRGLREALRAVQADFKRRKPAQGDSSDAQHAQPQRLIAEIENCIATLAATKSDVDTTVDPLHLLVLQIEPRLQAILECYCATNTHPRSLRACLRRRVLMLDEKLVCILWNSIKEEIREQHESGSHCRPEEFGQFPGANLACAGIVSYMIIPRPERSSRIQRIVDRKELPPLELVPGLVTVLTWGDCREADCPTPDQQMLFLTLQRLIFPLRKLTNTSRRDLLSTIGVRNLRSLEIVKRHFPDDEVTSPARQTFFILRTLVRVAHRVATSKDTPKRSTTRRDTRFRKQRSRRRPRGQTPPPKSGPHGAPWTVEVDAKSCDGNRSRLALRLKTQLRK